MQATRSLVAVGGGMEAEIELNTEQERSVKISNAITAGRCPRRALAFLYAPRTLTKAC